MEKILLIFGANGALGEGVSKKLLSKDYDEIYLFASGFNETLEDGRVKRIAVKDLSREKNVLSALNQVSTREKSHLFLFSAIGGYYGGVTVWETEENDFDRMFNINLRANYLICKNFSELVKRAAGGSVCLTSAYTSNHPEKYKFIYGASKSALNYLVRVLAEDGKDINLSVNALAPFIIDTPANRDWMEGGNTENWMKPPEIGELIHSLFDNYHFISGNIIELRHRFAKKYL